MQRSKFCVRMHKGALWLFRMDRHCYITQNQPSVISPECLLVFFGVFIAAMMWSAEKVMRRLKAIEEKYPTCLINVIEANEGEEEEYDDDEQGDGGEEEEEELAGQQVTAETPITNRPQSN